MRLPISDISVCSECRGGTRVSPDPPGSRLVATCRNAECGHTVSLPVRASALSLFGVFELVFSGVIGAAGYLLAIAREFNPSATIIFALVGFILGGVAATVLVRLVYHTCCSALPPALQREFVAHIATPSFSNR